MTRVPTGAPGNRSTEATGATELTGGSGEELYAPVTRGPSPKTPDTPVSPVSPVFWFAGVIAVLAACSVLSEARSETVVSVWYRGTPAGTPNQDDLAMLRAMGFRAVTWPASQAAGVAELRRQAAIVSLGVEVRAPLPSVTAASALVPGPQIDVRIPSLPLALMPATVWRAVAHGARADCVRRRRPGRRGRRGRQRADAGVDWTGADDRASAHRQRAALRSAR